MALLTFTNKGIYCPQADVFIDPNRKVKRAIITHGHSDHAKPGHSNYLCVKDSKNILQNRLGKINVETLPYCQSKTINGVKISFHPAGHIIGSAQVKLEYNGEVWVVSGDFKVEDDGISTPFEPVKCQHFITESTFALPIYKWQKQSDVFKDFNEWWSSVKSLGKVAVVTAYSLGKAQRIIANVDNSIGAIYCHHTVQGMNEAIINSGINLPKTKLLPDKLSFEDSKGILIVGPFSQTNFKQINVGRAVEIASMSGWNQLRNRRKNSSIDRAFTLSDHADWNGMNLAIQQSGAENIYVTHGYESAYANYLNQQGYKAQPIKINSWV